MRNFFLMILIITSTVNCKEKNNNQTERAIPKSKSVNENKITEKEVDTNQSEPMKTQKIENNHIADWTHPDFFEFKHYKEYKLTDTINIDLNGNGILESVYFEDKGCPKLLIKEKGQELISLGCGKKEYKGLPNAVGWVDLWCVVSDKKVWEVLFTEDGDIDKDTIVNLERPSIYIGKEEAGGGIITYENGKLSWIHQSD